MIIVFLVLSKQYIQLNDDVQRVLCAYYCIKKHVLILSEMLQIKKETLWVMKLFCRPLFIFDEKHINEVKI